MWVPRHIEKFESADGLTSYSFPKVEYEWEASQSLRTPFVAVSGGNYGINMRNGLAGLKEAGDERIRFTIWEKCDPRAIDDSVDEMRSKLFTVGRGKLWTRDADDLRRWSWGQLIEMPEHLVTFNEPQNLKLFPTSARFRRESDWYGYPVNAFEVAAITGEPINIPNPGNSKVYNAVFVLRGTFTNPVITNTTNGLIMQTTRDGTSSNDRVRFNAGSWMVEYSSNGGSSYADDYSNFVRQAGQTNLMILEPGSNIIDFAGISSGILAWTFYEAYS